MTAKSQAIVVTICGLLLAPISARANHVNLDGIGYVLFGLLVLAIMFVVNMVLFFVNLSNKKRSRAIKITVMSAILTAVSLFVLMTMGFERHSGGLTLMTLAVAIMHIAMIMASAKIINQNNG